MTTPDLTLTAPSPMMRTLDVATRLVAQAQAEGIEVDSTVVHDDSIAIYATDRHLTPALAVALGLTNRHVGLADESLEFFEAGIDGIRVQTHGSIPAREVAR